jgi:hypothetical protein
MLVALRVCLLFVSMAPTLGQTCPASQIGKTQARRRGIECKEAKTELQEKTPRVINPKIPKSLSSRFRQCAAHEHLSESGFAVF